MSRSPVAHSSSVARVAVLLAVVAALVVGTAGCQPRESRKDRPILFVHGWEAFGNGTNCQNNFGSLESSLRTAGFTGQMITVGFYDSDTNCDVNLRNWGNVDNSTSWRDLGKAFSQYVSTTFSSKGVVVDVVSHSMGGNIVRGAVQGSQAKDAGYATDLKIEDVATLAAPFAGAAWYANFCLWGQCAGLKPGADDIKWLATNGNPQGTGGTEWTAFGSTNDDVVPFDSAMAITIPAERGIVYSNLEHSGYMGDPVCEARVALALSDPNA